MGFIWPCYLYRFGNDCQHRNCTFLWSRCFRYRCCAQFLSYACNNLHSLGYRHFDPSLNPEHLVKYSATSSFKLYRKTQFLVIVVSLITGTLILFSSSLIADRVFNKPSFSFYFSLAAMFIVFKSLMILNTQAVRGLQLIRIYALMQTLPQGFNLFLLFMVVWLSRTRTFRYMPCWVDSL